MRHTGRIGLGRGKGSGYRNIRGNDPRIHGDSAKGIKQPQRISPFAARYSCDGKISAKINNPKFWQKKSIVDIEYEKNVKKFIEEHYNGRNLEYIKEHLLKRKVPDKYVDAAIQDLQKDKKDWKVTDNYGVTWKKGLSKAEAEQLASELPIYQINGKQYYRDTRLGEYRNVKDPTDKMRIDDVPNSMLQTPTLPYPEIYKVQGIPMTGEQYSSLLDYVKREHGKNWNGLRPESREAFIKNHIQMNFPVSTWQFDSKTFDITTKEGMEKAEKYQQNLYKKYDTVKITPFGFEKVTLTGIAKEKVVGGLADGKPDSDFDMTELKKGINVEMEHTEDSAVAKEIAKDHLSEFSGKGKKGYYDNLDKMEKKLSKEIKSIPHSVGRWKQMPEKTYSQNPKQPHGNTYLRGQESVSIITFPENKFIQVTKRRDGKFVSQKQFPDTFEGHKRSKEYALGKNFDYEFG